MVYNIVHCAHNMQAKQGKASTLYLHAHKEDEMSEKKEVNSIWLRCVS